MSLLRSSAELRMGEVKGNEQRGRSEVELRHVAIGLALALLNSAGQDSPLLYPGPLCGGEAGTTGRVAGVDRRSTPFRQHRDVLSKSPAPAHKLAGQDAREAPSGCRFLLGTALLDKRKRSTSGAAGARKLLLSRPFKATQLAPVNPLPRPHARTRPCRRSVRRPAMASGNTRRHWHSLRHSP